MAHSQNRYDAVIRAPFGRVGIMLRDHAVSSIDFLTGRVPLRAPCSDAARIVCRQLQAYFRDPRLPLNVPVAPDGTRFQRRVWRALRRIPPGTVVTYGALARRLRSSARAVGGACRANPVPLLVPCHRVVGATDEGGFMGYASGRAIDLKRWLLRHERGRQ